MKTLFDTTKLRNRTLKNRIWRSATWLALADAEGNVTDEIVKTYEELAKGGAAMIQLETKLCIPYFLRPLLWSLLAHVNPNFFHCFLIS